MTWEDLLTNKVGREVGKGLVTAVINQQISQQISVWYFNELMCIMHSSHWVFRLIRSARFYNPDVLISAVLMT